MKKGCWNDQEVVDLFNLVEDIKGQNKPLKLAFVTHAEKYHRKPNSVRNYYYFELEQLKKDIEKTKKLGINLNLHEKIEFDYFSVEEQDKLIGEIDNLVKAGLSIRKACLQLSGGDVNKMLRYQNKYRNFISKEKQSTLPDNIITFTNKKKELLSDSDINSLFLGLVRLVKRTAIEEQAEKAKKEKESSNQTLRKAMVEINKREREITKLKDDLLKIKLENSKLKQSMMKLKCEKASSISGINNKNDMLIT